MKPFFTILLFLFSIQLSLGQDQLDGPYIDYYDSGELKVEGQYKNKKRVGDWKSYHKNGQVSSLYSYKKGKRSKIFTSYYKDGTQKNKTEKIDDEYISTGYYENGKLKYKRQVETGYYIGYFQSGALKLEANYFEWELISEWKRYYENGQLEWLVTYKDGYRDGLYKHYYKNGDLKIEGSNSRDRLDGEEKRYLLGNILEWKGNYAKGVLSKTWTKYNTNGKKIAKVKFKEGVASKPEFSDTLMPTKVAEGVFERMPVFPGCEDVLGNRAQKKCANRIVAELIVSNFDKDMIANLGLSPGRKRIFVIFKIDKTGHVKDVKARGPHSKLEAEARRIIKMLPVVKPGTQRGKPVTMPYSIPIVFQLK